MSWSPLPDYKADRRRAVPLYVAVYISLAAALYALAWNTDARLSLAAALLMTAAGLAVGCLLRARPSLQWVGLSLMSAVAFAGSQIDDIPDLSRSPLEVRVGVVLSWLAVALTGGACTDNAALFVLVPAMAIVVASAAESVDSLMTASCLVFCIASVFALLYFAYLTGPERKTSVRQGVLNQVTLTAALFIFSAVLTSVALVPTQLVGSILRPWVNGGNAAMGAQSRVGASGAPAPFGMTTGESVKVGQGPTVLTYDEVMRVNSSERHMFLSRIYDSYNNQGWVDRADPEAVSWERQKNTSVIEPDTYSARWPIQHQQIRLLGSWDTLPAYEQLSRLQIITGSLVIRIDGNRCAHIPLTHTLTLVYNATSRVPPGWENVTEGPKGMPYPAAPEPPVVPARLQDLAARLKGSTDRDTAANILAYLQKTCTYDLNAPAVPSDRDAVDFFIFDSKAGYCDLFATSMALLLQLDGIPARYCIGFLPGEWNPIQHVEIVTAADAHAWVEVFIQGRGWIPVDATPPGFTGPASPSVEVRALLTKLHFRGLSFGFTGLTIGVALVLIIGVLIRSTPGAVKRRIVNVNGLEPAMAPLLLNYRAMEKLLGRAGLARRSSETPYEYAARATVSGLPHDLTERIQALTDAFVRTRYGHQPVTSDHSSTLAEIRRAVRRSDSRTVLKLLKRN